MSTLFAPSQTRANVAQADAAETVARRLAAEPALAHAPKHALAPTEARSPTTLKIDKSKVRWLRLGCRAADYLELTKPRIAALVLATLFVAMFVAGWGPPAVGLTVNTLFGVALVAASSSALNQLMEVQSDALMPRTADRPLPAGRLTARQVAAFAVGAIVFGTVHLAWFVNLTTALLGLITWALYVVVYTPLKRRSSLNTTVGALAGALPVLIGFAAVDKPLDLGAFSLFAIVFLWQFPHFMAIAWIYRRQYAAAGLQMLSVVDPSGRRAGAQAVIAALALLPVSLLPCVLQQAGEMYFAWAVTLGLGQLAAAVIFMLKLDEVSARRLLRASLVYLPALLFALVWGPIFKSPW